MNGGTHEGFHGAGEDGDVGAADGGEEGDGISGHIRDGSIAMNCGDLGFLSRTLENFYEEGRFANP